MQDDSIEGINDTLKNDTKAPIMPDSFNSNINPLSPENNVATYLQ